MDGEMIESMDGVQLFGALEPATEAALRASIERFGVLVPVTFDQRGRMIDGHHRWRLASELGLDCPWSVRHVAEDDEAAELARTLNMDRRLSTPRFVALLLPPCAATGTTCVPLPRPLVSMRQRFFAMCDVLQMQHLTCARARQQHVSAEQSQLR
jgi:hypothetical protein